MNVENIVYGKNRNYTVFKSDKIVIIDHCNFNVCTLTLGARDVIMSGSGKVHSYGLIRQDTWSFIKPLLIRSVQRHLLL